MASHPKIYVSRAALKDLVGNAIMATLERESADQIEYKPAPLPVKVTVHLEDTAGQAKCCVNNNGKMIVTKVYADVNCTRCLRGFRKRGS